ncbi:MAG: HAMP domain-containing protein, partial [Ignavibacteriae bacterium]|nr:HAMP domain-containing protein [Ignavibacteriota bacterium]
MKLIENLSISKKISFTVLGILCFTLSIYLVIFFVNNDSKVYDRVEEENQQLSSLLTESIRLAMASGADDTSPFVENLKKFEKIADVRIIPTHLIDGNNNIAFDKHEKKAFAQKKETSFYEDYENHKVLTSIKLLSADESCIDCHTDASVGDVLAVVSIRQSLDSTIKVLASQKLDAVWIGGLAALVTFLLVSFFVNKNLGKPVTKLSTAVQDFANGKSYKKIDCRSKDELGLLAKNFNEMAEKIEIQIQYLNKLPIPVLVMDKQYNITYINEKGTQLLKKKKEEIVGTKCYNNFKANDCNTENCACKNAMKSFEIITKETIAKPFGNDLPILYSGAPILNKEGEVIGALEAITDLSDSKEKEHYLERNTQKMLLEMSKLANGDLTVNLQPEKNGDTIAELFEGFNLTVVKIKEMISQVGEAIEATASASAEISSSSEQMAAGAQEQSVQAMEVSTSINEMTETILDTTKNISMAADKTKEAGKLSSDGLKIVNRAIEGMNRISDVVNKAVKTVEELGKSSEKIGEIVKVINEIADQTNLLALNAAIEAARAGEHGRGFAVVADEVRKLAERTTGATTEISEMIKTIQEDTNNAVSSIHSGTEVVKKGLELTNQAGESLVNINNATINVIDLVTQVATASEEQSSTSELISRSIEGISQVSHESAAG